MMDDPDFNRVRSGASDDAGDRLSPSEREMLDLIPDGIDTEELKLSLRPRARHLQGGTFEVDGFDVGEPKISVTVTAFRDTPGLRGAFARALASRARAVNVRTLRVEVRAVAKFVDYLRDIERLAIRPRDIDDRMLEGYRDWLDDRRSQPPRKRSKSSPYVHRRKGGKKLDKATKIARMGKVLRLLRILRTDPDYKLEVRRDTDLNRASDWRSNAPRGNPTKILTRPQLKKLVNICRAEVTETTSRLKAAWQLIDDGDAMENKASPAGQQLHEALRLHRRYRGAPPFRHELEKHHGLESPPQALLRLDREEYEAELATIYPPPRLMVPFLLLFAIYYRFNRSLATTLKKSDLSEQPSPHGKRLVGRKFKNRAKRMQVASWPVTDDPHNPAEMIETLLRWTSLIRPHAPKGTGSHLFLVHGRSRAVRSLKTEELLDCALRDFQEDHLEYIGVRFLFRAIRPSVIDQVHHLFDGDLLATAEAGQHTVRTLVGHYLSDGARKANEEALVPGMHMLNAFVETNGLVDGREDKRRGDRSAATPGFLCADRYGCTVPGQRPHVYCTAYGMCGSCKQGHPQIKSPEAFALVWKLREAIERSRPRMSAQSWIARWSSILDELNRDVIWRWPPEVREGADLDIPPLPTVE